jgi:hypothetical protein
VKSETKGDNYVQATIKETFETLETRSNMNNDIYKGIFQGMGDTKKSGIL